MLGILNTKEAGYMRGVIDHLVRHKHKPPLESSALPLAVGGVPHALPTWRILLPDLPYPYSKSRRARTGRLVEDT